jgi:hypothetical protein
MHLSQFLLGLMVLLLMVGNPGGGSPDPLTVPINRPEDTVGHPLIE